MRRSFIGPVLCGVYAALLGAAAAGLAQGAPYSPTMDRLSAAMDGADVSDENAMRRTLDSVYTGAEMRSEAAPDLTKTADPAPQADNDKGPEHGPAHGPGPGPGHPGPGHPGPGYPGPGHGGHNGHHGGHHNGGHHERPPAPPPPSSSPDGFVGAILAAVGIGLIGVMIFIFMI